jgi:P27 family predicted phage terminase small subunit
LGAEGKRLWKSIVGDLDEDWRLDARDLAYLAQAARCADELAELKAVIARDGSTVEGSKGQTRVHPAVAEARQLRLTLLRLLGSIEMTDPNAAERNATAAQQQARKAADARWRGHELRGLRRG